MDLINPDYLLRPKERTLDGAYEYLEDAKKELKKAQAKKNVSKDELAEKTHRVKILELKVSKYERMKDEKKAKKKAMMPESAMLASEGRKDSTLSVMERINDEIDEKTSDNIIADSIKLLGDSQATTRFLSYFKNDDESGVSSEAQLIMLVLEVLEKHFGFGDELLAKLIVSHAIKSRDVEEFEGLIQNISKQYSFTDEHVEALYKIVAESKSQDFKHEDVKTRLEKIRSDTEKVILKLGLVTEDKDQLLEVVVEAVGFWGSLMEVTNKIRIQLMAENATEDLQGQATNKQRLGKHIANMFSTVSYVRASIGSWNMDSAAASMDEATKSVWRATSILIDFNLHCVGILKDLNPTGKKKVAAGGQGDQQKLAKFFGAKPPISKGHPMDHLIEDESFTRDLFLTMEGQIKGGTLEKLIERLTHHIKTDAEFDKAFFLTYPSFTTPTLLLDLLIQRFQTQTPAQLTPAEAEYFEEKKLKPIREKVVTVLVMWVTDENDLFEKDEDLRATIIEFMITSLQDLLPGSVSQLESALNGVQADRFPTLKKDDKAPHPIMPKSLRSLTIASLDPLEIARQLAVIDMETFKLISHKEFYKLAWSKKNAADTAPHITAFIRRSTQLTSFVCSKILEETDVKLRADVLKHWILVADRCKYVQNYNSLMAIHGGLMSSSIHRLQRTWKMLGKREFQILEELKDLMSYRRNFGDYRTVLKNAKPPCLPFLGLYLTDLTFIEDGNKDLLANSEFINFDKRLKTARVIMEIKHFQEHPFPFQHVPQIVDFLTNIGQYEKDEEEFYEISQVVEKKESEGEVLARVLSTSGFI